MKTFEITAVTTTKGAYLRTGRTKEEVLEDLFHQLQMRLPSDEIWDFDIDTYFIKEILS
jgi:hypothetical protein